MMGDPTKSMKTRNNFSIKSISSNGNQAITSRPHPLPFHFEFHLRSPDEIGDEHLLADV